MKAHRPDTDQDCTVTVFANGSACPEYVLPNSASTDSNTIECFIPTWPGDRLTVSGYFSGTVLHGAIDLVADGDFLADRRIEGRGGEATNVKRKIDFRKVLDNPIPEGHTSIYPAKQIIEGDLHVKALTQDRTVETDLKGKQLGVGSLAIIVSVNQESGRQYPGKYPSITCGSWNARQDNKEPPMADDGGVGPTSELEVKVTDSDINGNRQSKHRRHYEQLRFGSKPWATFIFYYRTPIAIEEADCIARPDSSHALEPAGAGVIIDRTPTATRAPTRKGAQRKDSNKRKWDSGEHLRSITAYGGGSAEGNSIFMTPPPPKKKAKLFGQSLSLLGSVKNHLSARVGDEGAIDPQCSAKVDRMAENMTGVHQRIREQSHSFTDQLPYSDASHDVNGEMHDSSHDVVSEWINAEADKYLENEFTDATLEAPVVRPNKVEVQEHAAHPTNTSAYVDDVQIKDEPPPSPWLDAAFNHQAIVEDAAEEPVPMISTVDGTTSRLSKPGQHSRSARVSTGRLSVTSSGPTTASVTAEDIRSFISRDGIAMTELWEYLNKHPSGYKLMEKVAVLIGDVYYLKEALPAATIPKSTQQTEIVRTKDNQMHPIQPIVEAPGGTATNSTVPPHIMELSATSVTTPVISKKRPAPVMWSTSEGTPTTKRLTELAATRTALLARVEGKRKCIDDAKAEIGEIKEQRRLREEREERENRAAEEEMLAEIAELERLDAMADVETEHLKVEREREEAGVKEEDLESGQ